MTTEKEKELNRERNRRYRQNSKDKRNACLARYAEKKKEFILETKRAWKERNKKKNADINRNWWKNNPGIAYIYQKRYMDKYPYKILARNSKRRSHLLNAIPLWADYKKIENIYSISHAMTIKTGIKYHVDHIIPLRGDGVCGLHVPWNLQVLTAFENISKGNRMNIKYEDGE
jgi:hypothetical protein